MWEALHGGQMFTKVPHVQKKKKNVEADMLTRCAKDLLTVQNNTRCPFTLIAPVNGHYRAFPLEGAEYWVYFAHTLSFTKP